MHNPRAAGGPAALLAPNSTALPDSLRVLERGWLSSNSVLCFDAAGEATIVDTGYATGATQLEALVAHALGERRLARIVNTHLHSDHCGGTAALQRRFGAAIAVPSGEATAVASWDEDLLSYRATGQDCERFGFDLVLTPGMSLAMGGLQWDVLAAPGHDDHQVILWCAERRVLISADALWENGFGAIFPEIEGLSGFAEQEALLDLIAALDPACVIPGHGAPFGDVAGALARARQRLSALRADPLRNARHIAKALIKFWLLDRRDVAYAQAIEHFRAAPLFELIRSRYFSELRFADMIERLVSELEAAGVVDRRDGRLLNKD